MDEHLYEFEGDKPEAATPREGRLAADAIGRPCYRRSCSDERFPAGEKTIKSSSRRWV